MKKRLLQSPHFLKIMRITLLQTLLMCVGVTLGYARWGHSQEVLDRSVTVKAENIELKKMLSKIEGLTNVKFVYSSNVIRANQRVSVNATDKKLSEVLKQVLTPIHISYRVIGGQIMLNTAQVDTPPELKNEEAFNVPLEQNITGTVIDENKDPLPGVSIVMKGTTQGTTTDEFGKYKITVPNPKSVLVFTFIGYLSKEEVVGNKSVINVSLVPNEKSLDEVVVVGYNTTTRKNILGSVGSIKERELVQTTPVNAFDAIQGRLAGVQINSLGGPGEGSSIKIRGVSTFEGGANPLFIVDGQQLEDINNLNPNDIASLEVLKDGASAAIYGSKSANGVIIITTKSGKTDDLKLNVDYSHIINTLASNLPLANTKQRFIYENVRSGRDPNANLNIDTLNQIYGYSPDVQSYLYRPSSR
ncbi:MAG: TonB-dependent receptor plug domain-containing protein, partial [Spirosomataceae bacterium]